MYFSLKQPSLFSASMMEWSLDDSKKSIIAIIYKLAFLGSTMLVDPNLSQQHGGIQHTRLRALQI